MDSRPCSSKKPKSRANDIQPGRYSLWLSGRKLAVNRRTKPGISTASLTQIKSELVLLDQQLLRGGSRANSWLGTITSPKRKPRAKYGKGWSVRRIPLWVTECGEGRGSAVSQLQDSRFICEYHLRLDSSTDSCAHFP